MSNLGTPNMGTPNPGTPNMGTFTPVTPPPVIPVRRRRSFAGPFVLIVLGVIFLLGNLHMLAWSRLGTWFAHYWPVLLILWGVIKLIEYQTAQREGLPAPGIGAGGIFLCLIIVVCGLIATQAERFNWSGLREHINIDDEDFNNIFGETYKYDDHLEQNFTPGSSLKVIDTHGAVSVHASEDNKITVVVRKRIGAESQSDADKYNSQTKPTLTSIGGLVTIDAKTEAAGDHSVETDLDISVPRKVAVTISSRRGDVNVATREGNVEITSQHSDTSVEDVTGNVKITLDNSSARVEQITGDVHLEGHLNEVSVNDVKGALQMDGEFSESVKLARITKTVTFKSSRTDMEFSRIDGDLDLDSGDLHADNLTGPVRLITRSKDIRLEEVSGDVRVQNDNGGVEVSMRTVGNVQIDDRKGDIQLSVPEKSSFRLDARTRDGEIQSDFGELKVENTDREGKASGVFGGGGSHVVINNEHGGIEIRKASATPPPPPAPPSNTGKPAKALHAPKEDVEPTEN